MPNLRIETRPNGSLVLTHTTGGRWGLAVIAIPLGVGLLATLVTGGVSVIGGVIVLPLGVIAVLTGLAAIRHRDWMVFDRSARQLVCRRGLGGLYGRLEAQPFGAIDAIVVEDPSEGEGMATVGLRESGDGDRLWPIICAERFFVQGLVAALHEVGGWPVVPKRGDERW